MPLAELRNAIQRLKDFRPIEGAEEGFVYLCAGFCDALAHFPAYASLRRLAEAYETLTGPGSAFDDVRKELCALSGVAKAATSEADKTKSRWCGTDPRDLTLDDFRQRFGKKIFDPASKPISSDGTPCLSLLPAKAIDTGVLIRWFCQGEQTVHDPEWAKWNLFTVFSITECAVDSEWEFEPIEFNNALERFRDQIWAVWRKSDREQLLGSCLLVRSQTAVNAGAAECRRLVKNLCELDAQARAAIRAAEALCQEMSRPTRPTSTNAPGVPVADEGAGKLVHEVTISMGESCYVLLCEGLGEFRFTPKESSWFTCFARMAAIGAATEVVSWEMLNGAITRKTGPEAVSRQDTRVAKSFSALNARLRKWAIPNDGRDWICTVKGKRGGRCLNTSVEWQADLNQSLLRELSLATRSVSGPLVPANKLARHTPHRGCKLPARPRRDKTADEDDDFE